MEKERRGKTVPDRQAVQRVGWFVVSRHPNMTNPLAMTEMQMPYTSRRWMAVDLGWQAVYAGDTQTWYDAEVRTLKPAKSYGKTGGSKSFYDVVVNFNG